jgi:hypothetical protein
MHTYINPIGGLNLYNKNKFKQKGIKIFFLNSKEICYQQFNNKFIPNLSIIDIMMFNSKKNIKKMLNQYDLL